ncbi:MAG: 3-dehydroquinate dehydratase [Rhodobacterales bacterium 17-64-5]|jgi:nucleoside-triphosphatase THEP1|nr:MAG: 3-dehydroquinate dehydratase [Rhodobacterales bacterium 17-64-5]
MRLAYTMAPGRGDIDLVLSRLADRLQRAGWRTCGVVQTNTECGEANPCDMDVRVLPDGAVIRISQALGAQAKGCRLDPSALEQAVALVGASLDGADVLIINKFGKHEAEGRGFRGLIAEALALNIPVIVGVNGLNLDPFLGFSGDMAVEVASDPALLEAWLGPQPRREPQSEPLAISA